MTKKVGIILVNYRDYAKRFLADCRAGLLRQDYPREDWRVFIVDNASTPQSANYLKESFPEAEILIRPDGNYCAANNLGFRRAIEAGCDYIVTVNMDTEAEPGWLSELVKALELNPEAAIAQSKIYLYTGDEEKRNLRLNTLGNIVHYLGYGFTSCYGQPDREVVGYPEISGYASGCSFIIRSADWQAAGGYNEEFYMYHDDIEISLKVRLRDRKIILAPKSKIFHKYEFDRSIKMLYYLERNRYLTILAFYPWWLIVFLLPPLLLMAVGSAAYSFPQSRFGPYWQLIKYFLRPTSYRLIFTARRQIKSFSRLPFRRLARQFAGKILFQEIANPLLTYLVNPVLAVYWRLLKIIV